MSPGNSLLRVCTAVSATARDQAGIVGHQWPWHQAPFWLQRTQGWLLGISLWLSLHTLLCGDSLRSTDPPPAPKQAPSDKLGITGRGAQVFSLNKVSSFRKGKEKGFSWSQVLYFHPENSQNSKIRSYTPAQRQHAARS